MNFKINNRGILPLIYLAIIYIYIATVSAELPITAESPLEIVDMMNALLVLICCVFIFAIVNTIRNRELVDLIRSAHFFNIRDVITAWTLMGSAFLLFSITEVIYSFNLVEHEIARRLFRTLFGVLFAAGLFVQYRFLLRYIKQTDKKKIKKG